MISVVVYIKRISFLLLVFVLLAIDVNGQKKLYFPLSNNNSTLDTFTNRWYSAQLTAMNEPVLFNNPSKHEIYRFTWLRSFDQPVVVSIEKLADKYLLVWKEADGKGGYEPGKLIVNKQKFVDKATWDQFMNWVKLINFWSLSTNEKIEGTDGAEWILEGKSANDYHVVDRWTPDSSTMYYKCCDFLLGLTDIKIAPGRKY